MMSLIRIGTPRNGPCGGLGAARLLEQRDDHRAEVGLCFSIRAIAASTSSSRRDLTCAYGFRLSGRIEGGELHQPRT